MAASSTTPLTPTAIVAPAATPPTPLPSQTSTSGSTAITPSVPVATSDWSMFYKIVEVMSAIGTIVLAIDVIYTWRERAKENRPNTRRTR